MEQLKSNIPPPFSFQCVKWRKDLPLSWLSTEPSSSHHGDGGFGFLWFFGVWFWW